MYAYQIQGRSIYQKKFILNPNVLTSETLFNVPNKNQLIKYCKLLALDNIFETVGFPG